MQDGSFPDSSRRGMLSPRNPCRVLKRRVVRGRPIRPFGIERATVPIARLEFGVIKTSGAASRYPHVGRDAILILGKTVTRVVGLGEFDRRAVPDGGRAGGK